MKIEMRPLSGVEEYEGNPRLNGEAVGAVVASIKEFGFRQPIVVDTDGVIIVGHTRYLAAKELELKKVPVHVATDLTAEQIRAYRIADNKTGEIAKWDMPLLSVEMAGLKDSDAELVSIGFDEDELAEIFCNASQVTDGQSDPDDVPPVPEEATTRSGDIYVLGRHRLMCGDSSSAGDLDSLMDGASVQLVNMDPPYNVAAQSRSKLNEGDEGVRAKDRPIQNDSMSDAEFDLMLRAWFGNASRVLDAGRGFYIWGGWVNCVSYPAPMDEAGLYFSQAIIWIKEHPVINRKDFMGNHEWCFYGWKKGASHKFFGAKNVPDTWQLSRARDGVCEIGRGIRLNWFDGTSLDVLPPVSDRVRDVEVMTEDVIVVGASPVSDVWRVKKVPPQTMVHLTEKPVELAVRAIQYSSRPDENVLDLFGGSGSTLIGCEQTGRIAYLMEIDPAYCDVIVKRWEEFTGETAVLIRADEGGGGE